MKHVILYENFDLDKFMENPEEYFQDDTRLEIEEGDYVTSYRGTGQVTEIGPILATVRLIDGNDSVVKVPLENLTKISKEEVKDVISNRVSSQKEIKTILDDLQKFADAIETTSDEGEEKISGNLESTAEYLEEILTDIISFKRKDPNTTQYQDYSNLVSLIARIAHFVMDQGDTDPELQDRITAVLDKFYEISD